MLRMLPRVKRPRLSVARRRVRRHLSLFPKKASRLLFPFLVLSVAFVWPILAYRLKVTLSFFVVWLVRHLLAALGAFAEAPVRLVCLLERREKAYEVVYFRAFLRLPAAVLFPFVLLLVAPLLPPFVPV